VFVKNVPRHFIFLVFWGTHSQTTAVFAQHIVCIRQKRTQTFHFSCFWGYTYSNYLCFCTTYSLYSSKMYPNISFFLFFGVHILKPPLFCTTYSLCSSKTYPDISFFLFFGVHMPKPPFISHNKYIVQFTQNLSKTLFITSFHKNNRPAFETRLYFFLHQKEAAH
jgi:hypothetical protein